VDYYSSAWLLFLVLAVLVNVSVFALCKPFPLILRAGFQALVMAMAFTPVMVESTYGITYAPFLAKLAVDLIAGKLVLAELILPLLIFVGVFVLVFLSMLKILKLPVQEA